jgi:large subunit ribosomal protein L4
VRRLGLKVALSAKAAEGRIVIVESLHEGVEYKTKLFLSSLDRLLGRQSLAAGEKVHSVLCGEIPPTEAQGALPSKRKDTDRNDSGGRSGKMVPTWVSNAKRASKNLPHVQIMNQFGLNVYDILWHRSLALTPDALEALVLRLDAPIKR